MGEKMALVQVNGDAIEVFFSYVGDVAEFVDKFSEHFIDGEGRMKKSDWRINPVSAGAQLRQELDKRINDADVFVAFVDKKYPDRISADELKSALDGRTNCDGRPLLIPIILGVDGLVWWKKVRDRTPKFLSNIVYQKFFVAGTNKYRIEPIEGPQDIHDLRDWVIDYFSDQRGAASGTSPTSPSSTSSPSTSTFPLPVPPSNGGAVDHGGVHQRVAVALAALDSVEAHITTLRDFLRNIGELLRRDLEGTKPAPSMGRRKQIEEELRADGVPAALRRAVVAIIDRRDKATQIADRESRSTELLKLADELNAVIEGERRRRQPTAPQGDQEASAFYYIARMEEALMRMQTEKTEALAAAIGIYQDLEILYSDKPAIPYRLGWAYYREQKYDDALAQYTQARILIAEARAPEVAERSRLAADYELTQMRQRLPRYIGLIYWRRSEENAKTRATATQLDNLLTAYDVTSEGLGISAEADGSYHNDLLYYGLRYLEVLRENQDGLTGHDPEITEDMVLEHLKYLEKRIKIKTHQNQGELDTLCYGYDFFERGEEAVRAAKRLQFLLFEAPDRPTTLDPLQTAAAARAAQVIARYSS
jgi:hypothetical protein